MYCKKCGKQIQDDSEFCTYCGIRLKAPKMEDVLYEQNDADGDSYIAVSSPDVSITSDENEHELAKENDTRVEISRDDNVEEDREQPKLEFESFVDDEEKDKSSGKKVWIIISVVAILVIIGIAAVFMLKKDNKNNLDTPVLSEQTQAMSEIVTTAKQTETQAQDEKNGVYERKYSDGSKYNGNFKNGVWDGQGTYTTATGIVYSGTFTNGEITGTGKIIYPSGDTYEGGYKNGQKEGKGTLYSHDGSKFVGNFLSDRKSGSGEVWYANGDHFKGIYSNDLKNGYGEYLFASGQTYKGEYVNDIQHGEGQINYSANEYYKGSFQYGEKNGMGEYHLENGDVIKGNFNGDKFTGYFTYYNSKTNEEEDIYFENGEKA